MDPETPREAIRMSQSDILAELATSESPGLRDFIEFMLLKAKQEGVGLEMEWQDGSLIEVGPDSDTEEVFRKWSLER